MNGKLLNTVEIGLPRKRIAPSRAFRDSGIHWLGKVPNDWSQKRLKFAVRLVNLKAEAAGSELPYVGMENIQSATGQLIAGSPEDSADGLSNSFRSDDVLFGKLRPYLAKVLHANTDGLCSSELLVMRPRDVMPRFLLYYCLSTEFIRVVDSSTYGSKMPRASWQFIGNLPVLVPPLDEQYTIAAFLDRETATIDELIAKKHALLLRLKEKNASQIAFVLTHGVTSPDASRRLKPSGVPWLGDIPEHWEMVPIKYLAKIGNGSTPSRENPDYWHVGRFPWLNSSVVNLESVTEAIEYVSDLALKECHLPRIKPPAVLVGITGEGRTRGMATTLLIEATINQHMAYLIPKASRCDVPFLRRVLDLAYQFLRDESDGGGSTKGAITCEQLGNLRIPLPPLAEQRAIITHLNAQSKRMSALVSKVEQAVKNLQQLRASLITSAVTGQIDVRNFRQEAPCP